MLKNHLNEKNKYLKKLLLIRKKIHSSRKFSLSIDFGYSLRAKDQQTSRSIFSTTTNKAISTNFVP